MTLISIIVPAFNSERYIQRCLNSIFNQTYKNFEIVVINDGSTDTTVSIVRMLQKKHKEIILLNEKNLGVSTARNFGLEYFNGEFLTFVDSDDVLEPQYLETLYCNIVKTDADISICNRYVGKKKMNFFSNKVYEWGLEKAFKMWFQKGVIDGGVACKLYRRNIIDSLYFDSKYRIGEDQIFLMEAILRSSKIVFQNLELYNYVDRKESAMHSAIDDRYKDVLLRAKLIKKMSKSVRYELSELFRVQSISIFIFLIILQYKYEPSWSEEIYSTSLREVKESNTFKFLRKSNFKESVKYLTIKYFTGLAKVILKK